MCAKWARRRTGAPGRSRSPRPRRRPAGPPLNLDVRVLAPRGVFIRGRGAEVELGGDVTVGGTVAAPVPSGGLTVRRGTLDILARRLTFRRGTITFASGTLIPQLDLQAQSTVSQTEVSVFIRGTPAAPEVTFSSVPELPQDEILAQLLFGKATSRLSPFELAQIAAAVAQLTGVGGGGPGVLDRVRSALGLDRLGVGSGTGQFQQPDRGGRALRRARRVPRRAAGHDGRTDRRRRAGGDHAALEARRGNRDRPGRGPPRLLLRARILTLRYAAAVLSAASPAQAGFTIGDSAPSLRARLVVLAPQPRDQFARRQHRADAADALARAPDVLPAPLALGAEAHLRGVGGRQVVRIEPGAAERRLQVVAVHAGDERWCRRCRRPRAPRPSACAPRPPGLRWWR